MRIEHIHYEPLSQGPAVKIRQEGTEVIIPIDQVPELVVELVKAHEEYTRTLRNKYEGW